MIFGGDSYDRKCETWVTGFIAVGCLLTAGYCFGQLHQMVVPTDKKNNPYWQGCDAMKPLQRADDGSEFAVCTDLKGNRWEIVMRADGRRCTETLPKVKDTYRHYLCSETYELLVRPEVKRER